MFCLFVWFVSLFFFFYARFLNLFALFFSTNLEHGETILCAELASSEVSQSRANFRIQHVPLRHAGFAAVEEDKKKINKKMTIITIKINK